MTTRYAVIAVISAALFGIATPVSKGLLEELPVFYLAGLLYLGAGFGLFPFVILKRKSGILKRLKGRNSLKIAAAVLFGGILGPVFLLFGLQYASAASVSLWLNVELVATALLGHFFFKDYLGLKGWLSVLLTLGAGMLLTLHEGSSGLMAGLLVGGACIFWGLDNHFTALVDEITPGESTCIKGIAAGLVNCTIALHLGGLPDLTLQTVPLALVTGFFAYGISIMLYITSAQNLGATRSQVIFASAPFMGVLFSLILLGESISILQSASALIMAASIILVHREDHGHHHHHREMKHIHIHSHDDGHHDHRHENSEAGKPHTHSHVHDTKSHRHAHNPDLHHRHDHGQEED